MHLNPAETLTSFTSINMRAAVFLCLLGATSVYAQYQWNPNGGSGNDPSPEVCASNYASCGCCLIERQMDRMSGFFNHSRELLSTYLTEAKNAINQMNATASVFSVALANQNQCLGPFRMAKNITYGTVTINKGNHYDTSTGVYTAPVSGVYSFAVTIYSNFTGQGQMRACANLSVNGSMVAEVKEKSNDDHQDSSSVVITKKLQAGDKVSVVQPSGCAFCGINHNYNTFTGFLLYLKN